MKKILVTGFDAFGKDKINPTSEIIKRLPRQVDGVEVVVQELPTEFAGSKQVLREAIQHEHPDYLLSLGLAGGRKAITPERVAINLDEARIPDNAGQQPIDQPIVAQAPDGYFSQLPIKAMVQAMNAKDIPAMISNSAGTFVCNHVMYYGLFLAQREFPNLQAGFMHVPYSIEMKQSPNLSLEQMVTGVTASIGAIVTKKNDVRYNSGTIA